MKQLFLCLGLCNLATHSMYAQKLRYGIEAGISLNRVEAGQFEGNSKFGQMLGVFANYTTSKNFRYEIAYAQHWAKNEMAGGDLYQDQEIIVTKVRLEGINYGVFTATLGYRIHLGKKFYLTPEFGTYFRVGSAGTQEIKAKTTTDGVLVENLHYSREMFEPKDPPHSGFKAPDFHRVDHGSRVGLGIEYGAVRLKAYFDHSLYATSSSYLGKPENRFLCYSISYQF